MTSTISYSIYHTFLYFIFNAIAGAMILVGGSILNIFSYNHFYNLNLLINLDLQQIYTCNFGILILCLGFFIKFGLVPFQF